MILNIETSTSVCSVCLSSGNHLIGVKETSEPNMHSQLVHEYIQELMQQNGKDFSQLSAVAVCSGPGSYTGLRIGISAAKGIAYALNIPFMAISTLKALAWKSKEEYGADKGRLFCPTIDARRMEVYTAIYDHNLSEIESVYAKKMDDNSFSEFLNDYQVIFSGDGAKKCEPLFSNQKNALIADHILPSSTYMVELANEQFKSGKFEDLAYFEPFYLKDFIPGISNVKGLKPIKPKK